MAPFEHVRRICTELLDQISFRELAIHDESFCSACHPAAQACPPALGRPFGIVRALPENNGGNAKQQARQGPGIEGDGDDDPGPDPQQSK